MNKWKRIAEIKQDRIDELKEDNQRYRDELRWANSTIREWQDFVKNTAQVEGR